MRSGRISARHLLVPALVVAAAIFTSPLSAQAVPAPSITGPADPIRASIGTATTLPTFIVSGYSDMTVRVEVNAGSGTLALPTTTGVTVSGSPSGSVLQFQGSQTNVNTVLAAMTYTRGNVGTDTVTVTLPGSNQFSCPATGHVYQVVAGPTNFTGALNGAAAMFGGHGYLATVTSAAENTCIAAGIGTFTGDGRNAWIAARLKSGSVLDWEWVAGPEAGTTFWTGGRNGSTVSGQYSNWDRVDTQPQNDSGQACGQYYNSNSAVPTWHDNVCGASNKYVVEVDASFVTVLSATATVETIPAPPAADDVTSTGAGTDPQTATVDVPVEGSVTLLDGDTPTTTVTVDGEGTYTLDPDTGVITFTPVLGYTGTPTPVAYRLTDPYEQTGTGTYAPTVTAPAAPTAEDVTSTGTGTDPQTATLSVPVGGAVTLLDGDTPTTSVTVDDEGTYTLDPGTGVITFTPVFGFSGEATPVTYGIVDAYGQSATGTYAPTISAPEGPTAQDLSSNGTGTGVQTATITIPTGGDVTLFDGDTPTTTVTVDGEGTYTLDPDTGVITFVPVLGFSGEATPVTFGVSDAYGQIDTGTYAVTVAAPAGPTAGNVTSTGTGTEPQTAAISVPVGGAVTLLDGDTPTTTVTFAGQGTYTLDPDTGVITFVPVDGFVGVPTAVTFEVLDAYGQISTGTFAPTVVAAPTTTTSATSTTTSTVAPTSTPTSAPVTVGTSVYTAPLAYTGTPVAGVLSTAVALLVAGVGMLVFPLRRVRLRRGAHE